MMKLLKNIFLALIAVSMVGAFASQATAQSNNEQRRAAVQAFNQAIELAQNSEFDKAIAKYEEAIDEAEALGPDGADIIKKAKAKLPDIYFQKARNEYEASREAGTVSSLQTAIDSFEEAGDVAEQYGNTEVANDVSNVLRQLNYRKAVLQYRAQNFEASMTTINKLIEDYPNYATAYYHKGLIYKKMDGNIENALAAFDEAIKVAENSGESDIAETAKEKASAELVYQGGTQTQEGNYASAIDFLNRALEYNPESADAHYRLAEAYNNRGDFDQALPHAQKALDLENGGRNVKAKIYFQLASAYKGQGNYSQACDAFSNAAYGRFQDRANHEMEYELKCEDL